MKVSHQAFIELNDDLVQAFYEAATIDKWQGHRLLAVDGSVTQLLITDGRLEHFGKARSHAAMPHVRLSQLYDVKNNITLDLQVESHVTGEREMCRFTKKCILNNKVKYTLALACRYGLPMYVVKL